MKKFLREIWKIILFGIKAIGLTLLMSGAEIVVNAGKMAYNAIFLGATMNESTVTVYNTLKWRNLVKTNFIEVLLQAIVIIIAIMIIKKIINLFKNGVDNKNLK